MSQKKCPLVIREPFSLTDIFFNSPCMVQEVVLICEYLLRNIAKEITIDEIFNRVKRNSLLLKFESEVLKDLNPINVKLK